MKKNYLFLVVIMLFSTLSFAQNSKSVVPVKGDEGKVLLPSLNEMQVQMKESMNLKKKDMGNYSVDKKDFKLNPPGQRIGLAPTADFKVKYARPEGTFFAGVGKDYYSYNAKMIVGPAMADMVFVPLVTASGINLSWTMNNGAVDLSSEVDEEDNLHLAFNPNFTAYPVELNGTLGGETVTYIYGGSPADGRVVTSYVPKEGNTLDLARLAYADMEQNEFLYSYVDDNEYYGPGYTLNGVPADGIMVGYDKPESPLFIEGFYFLGKSDKGGPIIPEGKELLIEVSRWESDGTFGKHIYGTAVATASDVEVVAGTNGLCVISFIFEEEVGGFIEQYTLSIDEPFVANLTGFDESYDFVVFTAINETGGSAYTLHGNTVNYFDHVMGEGVPMFDIHLNIEGYYNTLYVIEETNNIVAPVEGGLGVWYNDDDGKYYSSVNVISAFGLGNDIWEVADETADWLSLSETGDSHYETNDVLFFHIEAEPLPAGMTGRTGDYVLASHGITARITVKQGDGGVGINKVDTPQAKVAKTAEGLNVSYPAAATSVAVYNVAGQLVAQYALNATGTLTIPASDLANGVYLFKFNGINQTVKVLK